MRAQSVLIVGDGWQRGTLSATRSLGAAGHRVVVGSTAPGHAARSRFAHAWVKTPVIGPQLSACIAALVEEHAIDVVFAGDDEHLLLLSARREELEPAGFPYPPHATVLTALDKLSLYRTAQELGMSVPDFATERPSVRDARRWVAKQRIYSSGADHTCYAVDSMPAGLEGELVYQEAVEGRLAAVVAFRDQDGALRYLGGQLADRVFPEPYGVSVRSSIVEVPPGTARKVEALLHRLGWWGLCELQFLVTPDQDWQLIDFNGRYFGSMALTTAAGVDLPNAWLAMATGTSFDLPPRPRAAATYQWLEGDLRRAVQRRPARVREVAGALRFASRARHSLWQADDPAPAVRHGARLLGSALKQAAR